MDTLLIIYDPTMHSLPPSNSDRPSSPSRLSDTRVSISNFPKALSWANDELVCMATSSEGCKGRDTSIRAFKLLDQCKCPSRVDILGGEGVCVPARTIAPQGHVGTANCCTPLKAAKPSSSNGRSHMITLLTLSPVPCPHPTEMVENMKKVASSDQELTVEERNLLSVAYKNVIGARRASWRIVSSIEQKEESKGNDPQVTMIKSYREKIEAELAQICEDILEVLDKHLIPSAASGESRVFYHKM